MQLAHSETFHEAPADTRWDEALLRVESYLRAHHLKSRVLLNELTSDIMREARASGNTGEEPVAAAMQIAHARIGDWFARAGNQCDWSDQRVRTCDRLALALVDFSGRWEDRFLSAGPVPPELASALASRVFHVGPELCVSHMAPEPLEFGFADRGYPNFPKRNGWLTV